MELVQLKQLVVIAEEKVLSHGAERLNISQPALSRSIQRLEDELGLPLFDRTKNSMVLNEAGAAIVEEAKKLAAGGA
ncbi:MAG: LysR family transcriptional regulator, partial [Treponema sp.]|nr:LysR family transcriptional regulator [Treponema sp.]